MRPRHKKPKPEEMGMVSKSLLRLLSKPLEVQHDHAEGHSHDAEATAHDHGTPPPADVPIYTIAVLLDGQVYEVLRAQEKLGDIFLANPEFVLVDEETGQAKIGMDYIDGKFK